MTKTLYKYILNKYKLCSRDNYYCNEDSAINPHNLLVQRVEYQTYVSSEPADYIIVDRQTDSTIFVGIIDGETAELIIKDCIDLELLFV